MISFKKILFAFCFALSPAIYAQVMITGDVDPSTATAPTWTIPGDLVVGDTLSGTLDVSTGGVVNVGGVAGTGTVTLGNGVAGSGVLTLGTGSTLNAASVTGGDGTAEVIFNHTGTSNFAPLLTGSLSVTKQGSGTTHLTGNNTYTGTTTITEGTLTSKNLANSKVILNGGVYNPRNLETNNAIKIGALDLNGGALKVDFGVNQDFIINSVGRITLNAPTEIVINNPELGPRIGQLFLGGLTNFNNLGLLSVDTGTSGLEGVFGVYINYLYLRLYNEDTLFSGSIISNIAPYLIPTTGDFLVSGTVRVSSFTVPAISTAPQRSDFDGFQTVNSLIFEAESDLEIFNELIVTSGDVTVNNGSATISKSGKLLTAPGAFAKKGAGTLIVHSDIHAGGPAGIFGGRLHANGIFNAPAGLTIYQNAQLGGTGLVNGNVVNNGTVAPGNSIGTLTVDGNFTQGPGGSLEIEFANRSTLDHLRITGTATLGGSLKLVKTGSGVAYGDSANILTALGGILGRFSNITVLPAGFRARQWQSGNNLNVLFAPASYTLVAQGENQAAAAGALDEWIQSSNPVYAAESFQLDRLRATQYPIVFESMLPHLYPVLVERGLSDAYNDGRSVSSQAVAGRWMPRPDAENDRNGWRLWTDLRGGYSSTDVFSMDEGSGTLLVGMDQQIGDAVLGLYVGGQELESDTGSDVSYEGDGMRYGVYGSLGISDSGYLSLVAGGGQTDYDTRRPLPFNDRSTASPESSDWFTRLEAGWQIDVGVTLTPFVGLQYSNSTLDSFVEDSGSLYAVAVDKTEMDRVEGYAGLELAKSFRNAESPSQLRPYARILYRSDFSDDPDAMRVRLDQGNSAAFDYQPQEVETDGIETGAGITWSNPENGWGITVGYTGFFGSDSESHLVNLGVSFGR